MRAGAEAADALRGKTRRAIHADGVRGGQLIARPSFFQLDNLRRARAKGEPWHLIVHEDVLIFRNPPKPAGSGKLKDSQREPEGPVSVAEPSGTRVRGEPATAA